MINCIISLDPVTGALYSFFQNFDILSPLENVNISKKGVENVKISEKGVQRPSYWV